MLRLGRRLAGAAVLMAAGIGAAGAQAAGGASAGDRTDPSLSYFGRASVKLRTAAGLAVYIDPYAPGDYAEPAALVLVTHGHGDHNDLGKTKLGPGSVVLAPPGAARLPKAAAGAELREIREGETVEVAGVRILALPAYNKNHRRGESLGYLVSFDGVSVYHAGDTSWIPEMAALAGRGVSLALFPVDGFYNMDAAEALRCAEAVKPRRVAAIHSSPNGAYDEKRAAALNPPTAIPLPPGATIRLEP